MVTEVRRCRKLIISGSVLEEYSFDYRERSARPVGKVRTVRQKELSSITSINRSRLTLRRLINANANLWRSDTGRPYKPIFCTFTFRENVTDLDFANRFFSKFIQRFNYFLNIKLQYVAVPEFQQRGAVHYHVVFFNLPYIDHVYKVVRDVWGDESFVNVKPVYSYKTLVTYLYKYMVKNASDERLFGRKRYFASRFLHRPMVIKGSRGAAYDAAIEMILQYRCADIQPYVASFSTDYSGEITYRKFDLGFGRSIFDSHFVQREFDEISQFVGN